jgi:16S rRNA (guanine(1405)-N(7))-methyltransferase
MTVDETAVEAVITSIKGSKKYRDTSEETIRQLAVEAVIEHKKAKPAEKAVRRRLHSIMAPYLGDPDYEAAGKLLTDVFIGGDEAAIRAACRDLMFAHLSTRERLPILDAFYRDIFAVTGLPGRLLDIACGLNPLAFPWMGLPSAGTDFIAYDIHEPRVQFLNHYFILQGLPPLAFVKDVAVGAPAEGGDVALFLKEMPRFERNYPGHGRALLEAIDAHWLVVSFPTISTHGGRNLTNRYREFFHQIIDGSGWPVTELLFDTELVFCAEKESRGAGEKGSRGEANHSTI